MSDTPTDPREENQFTILSVEGGCADSFDYVSVEDAQRLQSTNSNLAAEVERQNVILLSHSKAVGEFACGAPSVPDALRKLAAEVERLKTACEKEFQSVEQLSGENMKLAAEIAELKTARDEANESVTLNYNTILELRRIIAETEAELETAKLTLFQTEKRLDDKLRTALAELEALKTQYASDKERGHRYREKLMAEIDAARKERDSIDAKACELSGLLDDARQDRDTALAAKDAAEKRVAEANELMRELIAAQDDFDTASGALEQALFNEENGVRRNQTVRERVRAARTRLLKARKAALTPAPTQEPPAGGVTISTEKKGGTK